MAVDLVLRLCQIDEEDGGLPGAGKAPVQPGYDPATRHIALNDFTDSLYAIVGGRHTILHLKTFYDMPANQQAQFDSLWAEIIADDPTTALPPNHELVLLRVHCFRQVLDFWERHENMSLTSYDTPDDIQLHLQSIGDVTFSYP